jgi:hypothetical protein
MPSARIKQERVLIGRQAECLGKRMDGVGVRLAAFATFYSTDGFGGYAGLVGQRFLRQSGALTVPP